MDWVWIAVLAWVAVAVPVALLIGSYLGRSGEAVDDGFAPRAHRPRGRAEVRSVLARSVHPPGSSPVVRGARSGTDPRSDPLAAAPGGPGRAEERRPPDREQDPGDDAATSPAGSRRRRPRHRHA